MGPLDTLLARRLRSLWRARQVEVDRDFKRTLPLGDYIIDRWERAAVLGFGTGTSVYDSCLVLGDVQVGTDTWVGPFTVLDGSGGLTVGSNSTISAGVQIYSHESLGRTLSPQDTDISRAPTRIGSNCYLGPNVVVAMGVTIGDGAVVGANSFVSTNVAPGATVYGNPARPPSTARPADGV